MLTYNQEGITMVLDMTDLPTVEQYRNMSDQDLGKWVGAGDTYASAEIRSRVDSRWKRECELFGRRV